MEMTAVFGLHVSHEHVRGHKVVTWPHAHSHMHTVTCTQSHAHSRAYFVHGCSHS